MPRLEDQVTALKKIDLPPAALHAALTALDRERQELLEKSARRAAAPADRAKRFLSRLHAIAGHYRRLVAQGVKALAKPEAVTEAAEAMRSLLIDGRITLVPNAAHDGVTGSLHFRGLGDHVLEMAGATRRVGQTMPREINKGFSGSGGSICNLSTPDFVEISLR